MVAPFGRLDMHKRLRNFPEKCGPSSRPAFSAEFGAFPLRHGFAQSMLHMKPVNG
jgi:hypothetical protein